jgi:hypothetical protein
MHWCFCIAREAADPAAIAAMDGVDIQWAHPNAKAAAEAMVRAYGVVVRPVLTTRHTQGLAVDMNITWPGNLTIARADGQMVTISSEPRAGAGNTDLHQVGATYGVIKLLTDAPHWSVDGH